MSYLSKQKRYHHKSDGIFSLLLLQPSKIFNFYKYNNIHMGKITIDFLEVYGYNKDTLVDLWKRKTKNEKE